MIHTYQFGQKNNWRRRQWNFIVKHLGKPTKDAVCLVLAGHEAIDVKVAMQKGFREENIVVVERDEAAAAKIRSATRCSVVCAELLDVIRSWRCEQKIDVVVADFCSNYSEDIHEFQRLLLAKHTMAFQNARVVISLNLQRGRESGEARDVVAAYQRVSAAAEHGYRGLHPAFYAYDQVSEKHRGRMFFSHVLGQVKARCDRHDPEIQVRSLGGKAIDTQTILDDGSSPAWIPAQFLSYMSQGLVMDSAQFVLVRQEIPTSSPLSDTAASIVAPLTDKRMMQALVSLFHSTTQQAGISAIGEELLSWLFEPNTQLNDHVSRQVSAAMAVRSARLHGRS